jgi:hypothetical protein
MFNRDEALNATINKLKEQVEGQRKLSLSIKQTLNNFQDASYSQRGKFQHQSHRQIHDQLSSVMNDRLNEAEKQIEVEKQLFRSQPQSSMSLRGRVSKATQDRMNRRTLKQRAEERSRELDFYIKEEWGRKCEELQETLQCWSFDGLDTKDKRKNCFKKVEGKVITHGQTEKLQIKSFLTQHPKPQTTQTLDLDKQDSAGSLNPAFSLENNPNTLVHDTVNEEQTVKPSISKPNIRINRDHIGFAQDKPGRKIPLKRKKKKIKPV